MTQEMQQQKSLLGKHAEEYRNKTTSTQMTQNNEQSKLGVYTDRVINRTKNRCGTK